MSCSSHSQLPCEMWRRIFKLLPADDRNNSRLTCHRFNDLCNEIGVPGNEEMVFRKDLDTDSALNFLASSHRRIHNIRVYDVHVMTTFLPFFKKHGGNIHSLILEKCKFDPGLFGCIMVHCAALRSLNLVLSPSYGKEHSMNILDDIQALSDEAVTFDQVTDLKLRVQYATIWTNQTFLAFISLFPNVERVDLQFQYVDSIIDSMQFTSSGLYDWILTARNQLESLRLYFHFRHQPFEGQPTLEMLQKLTRIEMQNLKELSLNWTVLSHPFTTNPFLAFQNVTELNCKFHDCPSTTLQLLLDTIPRLRALVFSVGCKFPMSGQCFETLVKSQLTRLEITGEVTANFEVSFLDSNLQPNYSLKHYSIGLDLSNLRSLLASYCRCLESMIFFEVNEDTLYNIFKYQNNLRSLELINNLRFRDICGSRMWRATAYKEYKKCLQNDDLLEYRRLPHLTQLRIGEDELALTNFLLKEFEFPQLRSLVIDIDNKRSRKKQLFKILASMRQLKLLKLTFPFVVSFQQVLTLVQALPNLRHIDIHDQANRCLHSCKLFSSVQYSRLFNDCPTLRTISHNENHYFYDVMTKTIRKPPYRCIEYWVSNPEYRHLLNLQ